MSFVFLRNKKYRKMVIDIILGLGKSLFFNFRYLPVKQALHFPILLSRHCEILECRGKIKISADRIVPGMILIGVGNVALFPSASHKSCLELGEKSILDFKGKCRLGAGVRISSNGTIIFGKNFVLTANSFFLCHRQIVFGKNCLVSWNVSVQDTDIHSIYHDQKKINNDAEVVVGDHVWICANSNILKGSRIPNDVVVGFGSTVLQNHDIPVNCIWGQKKPLRNNIEWDR